MKQLGASRDYRQARGECLCDGEKLLGEAVSCGVPVTCVLTSDPGLYAAYRGADIFLATEDVLRAASPLKTPQTVLFACKIPRTPLPEAASNLLVLENIQDPGNLGAMLRTANAFQIGGVLLTGGCADLYNPKTIRASMGAVFRQPVEAVPLEALAEYLRGLPLYGAALTKDAAPIQAVSLKNAAVAVGNEGSGLTKALLAMCVQCVRIPMNPVSESLNAAAAAAVLMWEMYRAGNL